jgi:hypothetical protein
VTRTRGGRQDHDRAVSFATSTATATAGHRGRYIPGCRNGEGKLGVMEWEKAREVRLSGGSDSFMLECPSRETGSVTLPGKRGRHWAHGGGGLHACAYAA